MASLQEVRSMVSTNQGIEEKSRVNNVGNARSVFKAVMGNATTPTQTGKAQVFSTKQAAKRNARRLLEILCRDYNTTMEEAKVPMKGARKVTYLLNYGKISHPGCFVKEKDSTILIPDEYTVGFEAQSLVWTARIKYRQREDGSSSPAYEVCPVGNDGKQDYARGSGPQPNISHAFKVALSNISTDRTKTVHRPNGRLYIGVFYDTVQQKLQEYFCQRKHLDVLKYNPDLLRKVQEWASRYNPSFGMYHEPNIGGLVRVPSEYIDVPGDFTNPILYTPNTVSSFGTDMARRAFYGNSDGSNQSFQPQSHHHNPNQSFSIPSQNAREFLKGVAVMNETGANIGIQPSIPTFPSFNAGQYPINMTNTRPNGGTNPNANINLQFNNNTGRNDMGSYAQNVSEMHRQRSDSNSRRRKRAVALNARDLVKGAIASSDNMEDELEAVFNKVMAKLEDIDVDRGNSDDMTQRLLLKLDTLKKMLEQQTRMKRRRTDSEDKPDIMNTLNNRFGLQDKSGIKKELSSSSLDSILNMPGDANPSVVNQPPSVNAPLLPRKMYEAASSFYQGSPTLNPTITPRLGQFKSSHSIDLSDGQRIEANDLADVDFSELMDNQTRPVLVGCNLTHEGLYLTLDTNRDNAIDKKEIETALKCLRIPVNSSIVKKTFEACDLNGDGRVSMDEFLQFLKEREEELQKMFKEMDLTGDGYVTLEELKQARAQGVLQASDQELKTLIEWMDNQEDGCMDGKIEYEEFRTSMILLPPATTLQEIIECFRNDKK